MAPAMRRRFRCFFPKVPEKRGILSLNSAHSTVVPGGPFPLQRTLFAVLAAAAGLCANATPMLRLTNTAVGPVSVAVGGTATPPLIEAYNAGDGSLSLSVQSSANWLTATIGAQKACQTTTLAANCIP